MTCKYKLLTADAGKRKLGDPSAFFTTSDFKEVLKAKGRKALPAKRRLSIVDRPKVFKGIDPKTYGVHRKQVTLQDYAAANNIDAYVRAWRSTNHLTQ